MTSSFKELFSVFALYTPPPPTIVWCLHDCRNKTQSVWTEILHLWGDWKLILNNNNSRQTNTVKGNKFHFSENTRLVPCNRTRELENLGLYQTICQRAKINSSLPPSLQPSTIYPKTLINISCYMEL